MSSSPRTCVCVGGGGGGGGGGGRLRDEPNGYLRRRLGDESLRDKSQRMKSFLISFSVWVSEEIWVLQDGSLVIFPKISRLIHYKT